jgi:hypothetical protein
MYVTVRRYEGVTDPKKVGQLVDEGFVPIISEIPGFVASSGAPALPMSYNDPRGPPPFPYLFLRRAFVLHSVPLRSG